MRVQLLLILLLAPGVLLAAENPTITAFIDVNVAGIHEELRTLVESGLSNFQALCAPTRTPGEFPAKHVPGAACLGVVEAGARADLMLVQANPLAAMDRLRTPLGVMQNGKWWSAASIRETLEQNRRAMDATVRETLRLSLKAP